MRDTAKKGRRSLRATEAATLEPQLEAPRKGNESRFQAWLLGKKAELGWKNDRLADAIGIAPSSITYMFRPENEHMVPKLDTLVACSKVAEFRVTTNDLLRICGIDPGKTERTGNTDSLVELIDRVPVLRSYLDLVAGLDPEQLEAAIAYVRGVKEGAVRRSPR
jgi:DNA-binding XRE family transcriptional regulator